MSARAEGIGHALLLHNKPGVRCGNSDIVLLRLLSMGRISSPLLTPAAAAADPADTTASDTLTASSAMFARHHRNATTATTAAATQAASRTGTRERSSLIASRSVLTASLPRRSGGRASNGGSAATGGAGGGGGVRPEGVVRWRVVVGHEQAGAGAACSRVYVRGREGKIGLLFRRTIFQVGAMPPVEVTTEPFEYELPPWVCFHFIELYFCGCDLTYCLSLCLFS